MINTSKDYATHDAQLAASQGQEFITDWLTEENVIVQLDLATLTSLGIAVAEHKRHLVYRARLHKDNIIAITTSADDVDFYFNNMDWSQRIL